MAIARTPSHAGWSATFDPCHRTRSVAACRTHRSGKSQLRTGYLRSLCTGRGGRTDSPYGCSDFRPDSTSTRGAACARLDAISFRSRFADRTTHVRALRRSSVPGSRVSVPCLPSAATVFLKLLHSSRPQSSWIRTLPGCRLVLRGHFIWKAGQKRVWRRSRKRRGWFPIMRDRRCMAR